MFYLVLILHKTNRKLQQRLTYQQPLDKEQRAQVIIGNGMHREQ